MVKEGLDEYKHIELTQDEIDEAMLVAKMRKDAILHERRRDEIEAENRKRFKDPLAYAAIRQYMTTRADLIFKRQFTIDEYNKEVFELLCLYFANDPNFITAAGEAGIDNPSLEKGILLSSSFGHGKTWMMKLFSANTRQVYQIVSAKKIANDYENYKEEGIAEYMEPIKNAFDDKACFYQRYSGLCIDDFGAEGIKQNFGNKRNVVGDIIEHRYNKKFTGTLFHLTTNLTGDGIHKMYEGRVASRIREIFNIIELPGKDRRK